MTLDDLERLLLEPSDLADLPKAFEGLDERQRVKLSSPAQRLYRQLSRNKADPGASHRLKDFFARRQGNPLMGWNARETQNATLALFAVGPASAVKRPNVWIWPQARPLLDQIIRDRRPDWLDDWIAYDLERDFHQLGFATLRAWIRDGLCRKPSVDGYYREFAAFLMRTGFNRGGEVAPPISRQLLADPELLDDVESLFRIESNAFNTNAWLRKGANAEYETWPDALVKLAAEGRLERGRLLDLAVKGLGLDLKQNQLSGFAAFYKRLAPRPDEQLRHQQNYIGLLRRPVGHVVKFAVEMLAEVQKAGGLDAKTVLRELPAVFSGASKGNAISALRLINRIIARNNALAGEGLSGVSEALRHSNTDVQALALTLLETHAAELDQRQIDALAGLDDFLPASNRPRLLKLISHRPASPRLGDADERTERPTESQAGARSEAASYEPLSGAPCDRCVLSAAEEIEPIASVDGLIDAILHAIEVVDSPEDVERIVDAISRLAHERADDFTARAAPVLHRLDRRGGGANGMIVGPNGLGSALLDLVQTWLTGRLRETKDADIPYYTTEDAFVPMIAHLRAIAERVARRQGRPLLSAPTHKGGWIDPLVWIERLHSLQHQPGIAESMDLRLSLLRLAPDNRETALARGATLGPPLRGIASFALGGDGRPGRADRMNYATWIMAARCRLTYRDWTPEFAALSLHDPWPDSLKPARYIWRSSYWKGPRYEQLPGKAPVFEVSVVFLGRRQTPGRPGILDGLVRAASGQIATDWRALPTAAANRRLEARSFSGELHATWVAQWLSYVWPQNPAAAQMRGAIQLIRRIDSESSGWSPGFGHMISLFQRRRPWREPGHLLLCAGLIGKDADARGLAVDALIEGIEARLFEPELFASTLADLAEGEWVKWGRLADSLTPVRQVSQVHAAAVHQALEALLAKLDLQQKNIFRLMEVLVEARAVTGRPLAKNVQDRLSRVRGGGRSAALAKRLLLDA